MFFLDFFEALCNFYIPLGCQLPNLPTKDNTPPDRNILKPKTLRFPLKVRGDAATELLLLIKEMCLTYIVIKCFGSNHSKCHTKGKYSSYNVIATNFLHFENKIHQNVVYTQYRPWNNNRLSDIDQRWCSFIGRNLFTIEHNNRGWIIGKGNEKFEISCFPNISKN